MLTKHDELNKVLLMKIYGRCLLIRGRNEILMKYEHEYQNEIIDSIKYQILLIQTIDIPEGNHISSEYINSLFNEDKTNIFTILKKGGEDKNEIINIIIKYIYPLITKLETEYNFSINNGLKYVEAYKEKNKK